MEKETQDEMIKMKVRTFIGLIVSLIVTTNSFSIIYQKILRFEEQQAYDIERSDRKDRRILEEAKQHYLVEGLQQQLKECKDEIK